MSGGGAIPLEGVRYGLRVFANDLNPVAAIVQKATLEYPAKFGVSGFPLVSRTKFVESGTRRPQAGQGKMRHHRYVFFRCCVDSPGSICVTCLAEKRRCAAASTSGHHSDSGGKGKKRSSRCRTLTATCSAIARMYGISAGTYRQVPGSGRPLTPSGVETSELPRGGLWGFGGNRPDATGRSRIRRRLPRSGGRS